MEQPVEQRGHRGRIAQHLAPVLDGPVRSDDRAGAFVATHDEIVDDE
jgi:hypothetical protein